MDFIEALVSHGSRVYTVGGVNRDLYLHIYHKIPFKAKDYDLLVTNIDINALIQLLSIYGKVKSVGKAFGVVKLNITGYDEFDIALPRTEVSTGSGYRDFKIVSDPSLPVEIDLQRRDATINAIAIEIKSLQDLTQLHTCSIIDPHNGLQDIQDKIWRCVGISQQRFLEDPTRIIRAIRQSAEMDLLLAAETEEAIIDNKDLLTVIEQNSLVRLTDEFVRIINCNRSAKWYGFLQDNDILKYVGLHSHSSIISMLQFAQSLNSIVRLTALLIMLFPTKDALQIWMDTFDLGAAPHFDNSQKKFILLASQYIHLLNIPTRNTFRWLQVHMQTLNNVRLLISIYETINQQLYPALYQQLDDAVHDILTESHLAINGHDLIIKFGLHGKAIKDVKSMLFSAVMDELVLNNYDALLEYVQIST